MTPNTRFNHIPAFGLGTYPLTGPDCQKAIAMALDLGIRHIDTAQMYGNEQEVGAALRASGIPRKELFITTKVEPRNIGPQRFKTSVKKSLDDLGGPVDLLLIHWAPADSEIDAAVDRLLEAQASGHTTHIGVSNFSPRMMRQAQKRAGGKLICNQVEFHPLLEQNEVQASAKELDMVVTAYTPLARGKALSHPIVADIAHRIKQPASAVVLRWILQQGVVVIPMTTKRQNAEANMKAFTFELSAEDMAAISAIGTRQGRLIDGSWMSGRWDS